MAEHDYGWEALGKRGLELGTDEKGDDVVRVPLLKPIEIEDKLCKILMLREPTLGGLEKTNGATPGPDELAALISLCADIPPSFAARLKARDAMRCREALAYFLPGVIEATGG